MTHGSYLQGMETCFWALDDGKDLEHGSYLQGMETPAHSRAPRAPQQAHGSYLQGMETLFAIACLVRSREHGSYLQGMETQPATHAPARPRGHGSYLQGMETRSPNRPYSCLFRARILPTRNGNSFPTVQRRGVRKRTDPTYKEWKPRKTGQVHIPPRQSTDPTYKEWKRWKQILKPTPVRRHGSYLQGMETAGRERGS